MKTLVALARQFEREKQLSNPVVALSRQLERDKENQQRSDARLSSLNARLQKARQEYESFKKKLFAAHPQLKSLRGEDAPLKMEEAARLLDGRGALLTFAVSETKTCLFALTLKRAGGRQAVKLKAYILNMGRAEMAGRVTNFRNLIEQRSEQVRESARELYDLLLAGASSQLSGKDMLVIAPDSALWGLPFQALQSADNHYLVEDAAIVYAPSLTAYREMKRPAVRRAAREQLLAFGDPALGEETLARVGQLSRDKNFDTRTENENELKSLAGIYGAQLSRIYTGADASEERLKSEAGQSRILQLSVRAVLSDANPLHSAVLLVQNQKEDGMLQTWEIIGLNLKSDMVVMSDCEMASAEMGGDAVTGLSWGWLVAGCPTVFLNQ